MALAFLRQTADFVADSVTNPHSQRPFLAVTGASITLGLALAAIWSEKSYPSKIIQSPLKEVQSLDSIETKKSSEFPLDILPGARDVPTPYGSIRVYEWGPEDGQKVLLVHGISTPCLSLGGLAHALVDRGCRVMLFDLYAFIHTRFKELVTRIESLTHKIDLEGVSPIIQPMLLKIIASFQHRSCLCWPRHRFPGLVHHPENSPWLVTH